MLSELSIDDFKEDSRKQRQRGRHLWDLLQKIGAEEFGRRWKKLVADPFKKKLCNSLDYVYGEMKSSATPDASKAAKEKKKKESEKSAKDAERELAEANAAAMAKIRKFFEGLPDEEKKSLRETAEN